jgi:hypothetical protein
LDFVKKAGFNAANAAELKKLTLITMSVVSSQ